MDRLLVRRPYDQSLLGELAWAEAQSLEVQMARLHRTAERREGWLSKEERRARLGAFGRLVEQNGEELGRLIAAEGGKPLRDARVEVARAHNGIEKAREAVSQLVGREVSMGETTASLGRFAVTYREPRGLVLAISAFNHPINLLVHQAVTAFAAGCPVLIKPSPRTPHCAIRFVELARNAGITEEWMDLALASDAQTQALVADERVAYLSFIGSADVGFALRARLARGAHGCFEHGGAAPVLVDETADVNACVAALTKGSFYHAGQVCVSTQRIFAESRVARALAQQLAERAAGLKVGDPLDENTDVGPLVSEAAADRVEAWVNEARDMGAEVLAGGVRLGPTLFAPTVLWNVPGGARLAQKEIFGPVVYVNPYSALEEAVTAANQPRFYFQAAVFTNRLDRALELGRTLHGMNVLINDHTAFRVDWMPFGGHRESGLGVGGIEATVRDMTIERMVVFRGSCF